MDFMGMPPQQAAGFWTGLLIVLMIVLAFRVVGARRKHRVLFGDGAPEPVVLATRSFGNAAEYVPLGIGAMILMSLVVAVTMEIHLFGAPFLLGMLVHGFGSGAGRLIGMILTITALGYAAFLLLLAAAIA